MLSTTPEMLAVEYFRAVSSGHSVINMLTPEEHESSAAEADLMIHFSGAHIIFGGNQPMFRHDTDTVYLPYRWNSQHVFYTVAFHELVHWTGHATRLNRRKTELRPDLAYNFEEFVAQFGSNLLLRHFHMNVDDFDHAYYMGYSDNADEARNMLEHARDIADKAVDYLLTISERNMRRR